MNAAAENINPPEFKTPEDLIKELEPADSRHSVFGQFGKAVGTFYNVPDGVVIDEVRPVAGRLAMPLQDSNGAIISIAYLSAVRTENTIFDRILQGCVVLGKPATGKPLFVVSSIDAAFAISLTGNAVLLTFTDTNTAYVVKEWSAAGYKIYAPVGCDAFATTRTQLKGLDVTVLSMVSAISWCIKTPVLRTELAELVASANAAKDEALTALFENSSEYSRIKIPDAILQTVIGKLAERTAHTLELPLGSVFLILLAGASASVMTNYCTQFRSRTRVALGVYTTVEQPPSTQKSRALSVAIDQYQKSISTHNKAIFLANEGVKSNPLPYAFKYATDPTTASLDNKLSTKDSGRFVIASAEQAAFQTLFPEASNYSSNNGLLLNGWAGEYVASERAGRESFTGKAQGAIILFAQHGSIQRVLNASQGQGLTERFLFASEPTSLGMRTLNNGYLTDQDYLEFNTAAKSCVSLFSNRIDKPSEDLHSATSLDRLELTYPSESGYDIIRREKMQLEPLLGELNAQGELTYLGWLGKLETHVLKIASVLHVFNCQANELDVDTLISDQLIRDSMELVLNIGEHMRALIQDGGEAGKTAEAETIIEVISSGKMTTTTATQKAKNRKPFKALGKDAYAATKSSISELLEKGILRKDESGILRVT